MYRQTVALPGGSAINKKSLEGEQVRRQFVEIYRLRPLRRRSGHALRLCARYLFRV
jgi:hypothetical protein